MYKRKLLKVACRSIYSVMLRSPFLAFLSYALTPASFKQYTFPLFSDLSDVEDGRSETSLDSNLQGMSVPVIALKCAHLQSSRHEGSCILGCVCYVGSW